MQLFGQGLMPSWDLLLCTELGLSNGPESPADQANLMLQGACCSKGAHAASTACPSVHPLSAC